MRNYMTPGVYVEEVPSANKPIEGVGTSVAAFVGLAPGGPVNEPVRVSSWANFVNTFSDPADPEKGPYMDGAYLAHSVYGFFLNGGKLCWIVRVGDAASAPAVAALPAASDSTAVPLSVEALNAGEGQIEIELTESEAPKDAGPNAENLYKLTVTSGGETETFEGSLGKKGRTNLVTRVNAGSKLVKIVENDSSLPDAQRIPAAGRYTLTPGTSAMQSLEPIHFEGDVASRKGMGGLSAVDEITMVCMPDAMTFNAGSNNGDGRRAVKHLQTQMIAHCENAGDRMAILDAPPDMLPQDVLKWRSEEAGYDSKFAALYYPWLEVNNPLTNRPILVPPSGHMAGAWCRTDATRGVHKAPANMVVLGAAGLGFQVTHDEQGELNRLGINCIRAFPSRGIRIWGARTLSSDPEWRYINVRRIFNFVSESLMEGTQWSVFEPNDHRLWKSLRLSVSGFLFRVWESGALAGRTPAEGFFVKCDEETNPQELVDAGQVTCEIGIAPVKPAEFVVFRLSQFNASGSGNVEA